jgi:hypothetical protein
VIEAAEVLNWSGCHWYQSVLKLAEQNVTWKVTSMLRLGGRWQQAHHTRILMNYETIEAAVGHRCEAFPLKTLCNKGKGTVTGRGGIRVVTY